MVRTPFVPDRGDVIWLQFNPQAGHEQAGRRPALVISPQSYNEKVGLAVRIRQKADPTFSFANPRNG